MLVIRLLRTGKKHQPFYQIVVTDKKNAPRGGRFVEKVGYLNPLTKELSLNKERVKHWISKGAQCSDRIHNLLIKEGVIEGKKVSLHKKKKKEEKPKAEVKPEEKAGEPKPVEEKPEEPKPEEKEEAPAEPVEEKKEEAPEEKPVEEAEEKKE